MTISKTLSAISSILIVLTTVNLIVVFASLSGMKGDGRIVNYSGIVRGGTQRLVKLELAGKPSDELIKKLDSIVTGLISGSGELDLVKVEDAEYRKSMAAVSGSWDELKGIILLQRNDPEKREALIEKSESYFELTNTAVTAAEKYSAANVLRMQVLQGILFVINIAVIAGIMLIGRVKIARPLLRIIDRARDLTVGEGDLSARIDIRSKDEIGELAGLFNNFIENIRGVIVVVKDIAMNLASSSDQMSATTLNFSETAQGNASTAEEVSASMEEMSATMDNIADGAGRQIESLRSMIAEIQKLSMIITETGNKIRSTSERVVGISVHAHEGEEALRSMSDIIRNIGDSSVEMGGIVAIINDISDQINLLSLNAAIESARAGEAGRGFAVVADEISKLAEKTAASIRDIVSLIKLNESETEKGIAGIDRTVLVLSEIISGVNDVSGKFSEISGGMLHQIEANDSVNLKMANVQELSEAIAGATSEQKTAAAEVVRSIGVISELAQGTASGAEELAATSEEIAGMADSLKARVEFFKV